MPVTEVPLDSSTREEDVTILHGKNLLLKLIENEQMKRFASDKAVEQFLSTEDMCFKGFREPMERLVEIEARMNRDLEGQLRFLRERLFIYSRTPPRLLSRKPLKIKREREIPKYALTANMKEMSILMRSLKTRDNEMLSLEQKVREFNKNLEVLYPAVLLRCPNCGSPITRERKLPRTRLHSGERDLERFVERLPELEIVKGEFKGSMKCSVCELTIEREKAIRTHFHAIKESIRTLWTGHSWLEFYIANLLNSMEWQTWSHVHILGSSGVRHEVDVLGVKKGYLLVCECKTGHVTREDVFNFWAKVYDIRSHVSMLALIEGLPEPETREFLAKNPSVLLLENLGDKRRKQIIKDLEGGILGRVGTS